MEFDHSTEVNSEAPSFFESYSQGPFHKIDRLMKFDPKRNIPEGIYLDNRFVKLKMSNLESLEIRQEDQPIMRGGSAHNISFFTLTCCSSQGEKTIPVAVKEYKNTRNGVEEIRKIRELQRMGISTFSPVMYLKTSKASYFFTKTNFNVTSLDRYNWEDLYNEGGVNYNISLDLLSGISKSLALIHSLGILHGDPQLKNFVVDTLGKVKLIDWEACYIHNKRSTEELAMKDLGILYKSCIGLYENSKNNVFKGKGIDSWSMFKRLVIDSYVIYLMEKNIYIDEEKLENILRKHLNITF